MRKWFKKWAHELLGIGGALSAASGAFWFFWLIWGKYIKELFQASQHITVHSVVWAGGAIAVLAVAVRFAERRYGWLNHSMYYVLSHWFQGKLGRGVRVLDEAFSSSDRKHSFISMYVFSMSDHWLAQKVEEWGVRILHILFWPIVIVAATHSLQDDVDTAGGYVVMILVVTTVWALVGVKLRNLMLLSGIASWLAYTALTQGGIEAEAQAAVIGAAFVLWGGWREWQRRISYPVERRSDDEPDHGKEEGEDPKPTT